MGSETCGKVWKLAEEIAGVGYWEWEVQSGQTFWSERKKRIYGLESTEEAGYETFLSVIDDETRRLVEEEIEAVLAGTKEYYDLQHRIFLRDGREVWVHEKGYPIRNDAGEIVKLVGIVIDITARKKMERALEEERRKSEFFERFDPLTRLPNRLSLTRQIEKAIRKRTELNLFFLDIEEFGTINSTFGHDFGDRVLRQLAGRMERLFGSGQVFRYGADGFALLLPGGIPEMERARSLLDERLYCKTMDVDGESATLGFNTGIARYPDDSIDARELIDHASTALAVAKSHPRNHFVRFLPYMKERISRHYHSLDALRQAIDSRSFHPYYQPIVDLRRGKVLRVEALARWMEGESLYALPGSFLPLAQEQHLIHHIDHQIMERALEDLERWHARGWKLELSCNVHLDDFSRSDFLALFRKHSALLPSLVIEISEEELLRCSEEERERMELLRSLGIRISIDDFGTGYSSLRYLHTLPIDEIKIDRSFLRNLPGDPRNEALVQVLKEIAGIYDLDCIVEGVEEDSQSRFLASQGLLLQQGFLFGRPVPSEEILPLCQTVGEALSDPLDREKPPKS